MTEHDPGDVTLGTLHDDMTAGFADMRAGFADMRTGFADLKAEMGAGFADMRAGFADLKAEMRAGFADLKATMITGFSRLPTRESSEEMVRLLREGNRLAEGRFAQLDERLREQHLETQQVLHATVESQRLLVEEQRLLVEEQRLLVEELRRLGADHRGLSADIKALITRIDGLFRPRDNGENPA